MVLIGIVFVMSAGPAYSAEVDKLMASIGLARIQRVIFAPDFTLTNLKNKKVNLRDYRGKIVLLNFMDTGCHWCRKEMPHLQKLYDQFKNRDFVIVVVFTDRDGAEVVAPFIKKSGYTFSVNSGLLDTTGEVSYMYGITGTPTSFILGREGEIIGWGLGYREWSRKEARDLIEKLLMAKN
jgi:peroxiredoxin